MRSVSMCVLPCESRRRCSHGAHECMATHDRFAADLATLHPTLPGKSVGAQVLGVGRSSADGGPSCTVECRPNRRVRNLLPRPATTIPRMWVGARPATHGR